MTPKQTIEAIYDAFNRGDIPYIVGTVKHGASWRQSKMLPWGGDYKGPEGAAEFFQKLDATMETVAFVVHESIEVGSEVFSFGIYEGRSRATGRTGRAEWMFRWKVQDGRVAQYDSYTDSAALVAAIEAKSAAAR